VIITLIKMQQQQKQMFFLLINRIWNGRKFFHTSWSLRPEAQDTIHQPPQDAKNTSQKQSISLLHTQKYTHHTQLCPDECSWFILQELGTFVTCDTSLSSSRFLALIKLPAASVTNTLLISRLLLAKTDFRLYKK